MYKFNKGIRRIIEDLIVSSSWSDRDRYQHVAWDRELM
jgi:hypothetical protein